MKTILRKGYNGWEATSQTLPNANGKAWQITTHKSGKGVKCSAIEGTLIDGNFTFDVLDILDKTIKLAYEAGMCTENRVNIVHTLGLIEFQKQIETLIPKDVYTIGIGQIIFTDFQSDIQCKRVIYEVMSSGRYKTVSLDGKTLQIDDYIKPYSEKFGIGVYYNEGELLPIKEVELLVEAANIWNEIKSFEETEALKEKKEYKENAIVEGSKIISEIPSNIVSVIVAQLKEDESDGQTDYFASKTIKTVYLAFSIHNRDLFSEMRKAATNFDETVNYSIKDDSFEHRENYSGGSGYYLGKSKYSGWIIKKIDISHQLPKMLEKFQIAAFEGRFLCNGVEKLTA